MAAKTKVLNKDLSRVVLAGAGLITLFFFTSLRDPFNAPKFWLTMIIGGYLIGHLATDFWAKKAMLGLGALKATWIITAIFVGLLFVSALSSGMKYTAFVGDNQRNTGFLTYLFLSIFLLAAARNLNSKNVAAIYVGGIVVGILMTLYGVLQHFGHDFVKWNNPYNSIISTVGNPDFASGILSVFLVLTVTAIFATAWHYSIKIVLALLSILTLAIILWSQARQGLLAFGLAIGIFAIIWIGQKNRKLGYAAGAAGVVVFIVALFGILNSGPLKHALWKPTVSVRGFYWRAGLKMLTHHPLFGVGPDQYGDFFRQYREARYPLTYGFDLTSTAAHNVVIEIFATGGIFVGISYLLLLLLIVWRGIVGVRQNSGKQQLLVAGLFCAWIAYEAQSLVSIDNIGIAIWGWVLGGAVIGASLVFKENEPSASPNARRPIKVKQDSASLFRPIVAAGTALIAFVAVIPFVRAESSIFYISGYAVPSAQQGSDVRGSYHQILVNAENISFLNPMYRLMIASDLAQAGYVDEAFVQINRVIQQNPKSYAAYGMAASFYEQLHQYNKAIPMRQKMVVLDPYGAQNQLTLGTDYIAVGDKTSAKKIGSLIISYAGTNAIAQQAKTVLGA
jgi:O-antigen ligase